MAGKKVDGSTDAKSGRDVERAQMSLAKELLLGTTEPDEQQIGARSVDALDDLSVEARIAFETERRAVDAGDPHVGIVACDGGRSALSDTGRTAEQIRR
jgi:hypothetical protein